MLTRRLGDCRLERQEDVDWGKLTRRTSATESSMGRK